MLGAISAWNQLDLDQSRVDVPVRWGLSHVFGLLGLVPTPLYFGAGGFRRGVKPTFGTLNSYG